MQFSETKQNTAYINPNTLTEIYFLQSNYDGEVYLCMINMNIAGDRTLSCLFLLGCDTTCVIPQLDNQQLASRFSRQVISLVCGLILPLGIDWGWGSISFIFNKFRSKVMLNFWWSTLLTQDISKDMVSGDCTDTDMWPNNFSWQLLNQIILPCGGWNNGDCISNRTFCMCPHNPIIHCHEFKEEEFPLLLWYNSSTFPWNALIPQRAVNYCSIKSFKNVLCGTVPFHVMSEKNVCLRLTCLEKSVALSLHFTINPYTIDGATLKRILCFVNMMRWTKPNLNGPTPHHRTSIGSDQLAGSKYETAHQLHFSLSRIMPVSVMSATLPATCHVETHDSSSFTEGQNIMK
jgi:hypothetical protein